MKQVTYPVRNDPETQLMKCPEATLETEALEKEVLTLINHYRKNGYECPEGYKPPTNPLALDSSLQSAARYHSQWLIDMNHKNKLARKPSQQPRWRPGGHAQ